MTATRRTWISRPNATLRVLEAVTNNQRITQRGLADHLGIALGLANVYVRRLARKGHIKCKNIGPIASCT